MNPKFIIAGGGTGGHIFPAIAIAQALKEKLPNANFLFVGAKGKMEMEKVPQAGFKIEGLDIAGFNRSSLIKNLALPFKLLKSFFQVRRILHTFKPDAVIGVGGYSTFPVLRWAQMKGIPTFIHEANAYAGKSNQLLAKKAVKVFTGTNKMESFFPKEKIVVTGNPVRQSIVKQAPDKAEAIRYFGLKQDAFTLLVVGGSLGALSINKAIGAGIDRLQQNGIQLIWQTGKPFVSNAKALCEGKVNVWVNDFITDMTQAYAAADLVVSRAGAMSVAEISIVAKPVIFVPYPFAAEDHQNSNAKHVADRNGAWIIQDAAVDEKLIDAVITLAGNELKRKEMQDALKTLGVYDADKRITDEIIKTVASRWN
jgi:UDP-N-acetylglucosamine--N-acetylmuramyl-(pentapeptide) pyrophosphoryl-undecaprenol N-acetylglucosamine transferase